MSVWGKNKYGGKKYHILAAHFNLFQMSQSNLIDYQTCLALISVPGIYNTTEDRHLRACSRWMQRSFSESYQVTSPHGQPLCDLCSNMIHTTLSPARTCPQKPHETSKDANMATSVTPEQADTCMSTENHCLITTFMSIMDSFAP